MQYKSQAHDPIWRLNNLYRVSGNKGELFWFKQNNIQRLTNNFTNKRNMILKARQVGISTDQILKQFDATCFNKNFTACILADQQSSIEKLFKIVINAYRYMPEKLKPQLGRGGGSKYSLEFPAMNSRIFCALSSHGHAINHLHISEDSFIEDYGRVYETMECVPKEGTITKESIANGLGRYYDEWNDTNSVFDKHFYPWFFHEDYFIPTDPLMLTEEEKQFKVKAKIKYGVDITDAQINYRRFKQQSLKERFIEKYPEDDETCFLKSGDNIFNVEKIKEFLNKVPKQDDEIIKIFHPKNAKANYVIACDTAEGVGGDYSTACFVDVITKEEVAFLRCKLKPSDFAHKVVELATLYIHGHKYPLISVERNNHGHAVILELQEHIKWPNLYTHEDGRIGWVTDRITKPIMINAFRDAIENQSIKINNAETFRECLTFINKNGKMVVEDGKHDDCIIATSIAIQMLIKSQSFLYDNIGKKIFV